MHAWESIQKTLDFIEKHLQDEISANDLAGIVSLSVFYYQRLFTRLVKKPVQEYIKLRRLARASKALEDKNNRILDVALAYGFGSHDTFTRAFKDAYGFTPTEYRSNPVMLNNFNKPDLLLGYVMIDEGVPLVSDGMVLEINRKTMDAPVNFIGVSDYVRIESQIPAGMVTGVDTPGAIWARFEQEKNKIRGKPNGRNLGASYLGDAPKGCFTYFAGTESENNCENYQTWQLPAREYVVCSFEAESFEELVTNSIDKAGKFTSTWIAKHGLICADYSAEMYFRNTSDVAYMETWYPVKKGAVTYERKSN